MGGRTRKLRNKARRVGVVTPAPVAPAAKVKNAKKKTKSS